LVEIKNLEQATSEPDFWLDQKKAVVVGKRLEAAKQETDVWQKLLAEIADAEELVALEDLDQQMIDTLAQQVKQLTTRLDGLEFYVLFNGPYDRADAIISIHAGTGGVEAQDWAQMLERMYSRFVEERGWQMEIIDRVLANEAGIKRVMISVKGAWAYGHLRSESGVHRLVRISPFDAEQLRQTSFALVEVLPDLPETEAMVISETELEWEFHRAGGPGGQNVNKVSSAVRLKHLPSGIVVECRSERSQHQNRAMALSILRAKLLERQEAEKLEDIGKIKGKVERAEWGRQIRSYVLQPYQMVKDHRTNYSETDTTAVLDGEIMGFVESYLRDKR
jgi:peptide chain release factor 2